MEKNSSLKNQSVNDVDDNIHVIQLREEQLDIAKKWIQTGEVKIYKENFIEERKFVVPIIREELVIEKRTLASATSTIDSIDVPPEIIHILLSEERVEFTKHKVTLEDVSIYKHQIEDVKHIEEILKREEAKIKSIQTK